MRKKLWSMLPVVSALRVIASSSSGNAGAQWLIASESGTPRFNSSSTASYRALLRASSPISSAIMRKARTSGTPAESSVPRLRQKSASWAVFIARKVAAPAVSSLAAVTYSSLVSRRRRYSASREGASAVPRTVRPAALVAV